MNEITIFLLILIGMVTAAAIGERRKRKNGQPNGCAGCPNYNHCRAHIGCSNNPNNRKKKES